MLLSIIIPVYNVEKYILECLGSLRQQLTDDIEILCIDDCGIDKSVKLIEEFIIKNKVQNVRILSHETNKGLSEARNTGILNATGKYIMFLDSDDMVKEGSIKRFIEAISKYNLDFVEGNVEELYENQNIRSFNNFKMETTEILNGKEFFSLMIKNKNYIPVVWNKIYAKEFLIKNDLFFKERLISEDEDFTIRMLMSAKHVMHLSDDIYIYRVRDGSIMSMFNKNNDWISSYCYIINVIKNLIDKEHDVLIKRGLATRENQIVTSLIKNAVQCNLSTEEVDKIIEIIKLKKLYVIKPNPYGIVEQFQLKLIKYPKAFCQLYRFCLKMKEVLNL